MITPQFTGQYYRDTTTGNIWKSNSTTPGDWSLVVQDMQVVWTPLTLKLGEHMGFFSFGDMGLPGPTPIVFEQQHMISGFDLEFEPNVSSVSWPNLIDVDPTNIQQGYITLSNLPSLSVVSAPLLQTIIGLITLHASPLLVGALSFPSLLSTSGLDFTGLGITSLSIPNYTTATGLGGAAFSVISNPALTSIDCSAFLPINGKNVFAYNNALDVATVNLILARCVANPAYASGTVDVSGQTPAAPPSGQGILDKATLQGRIPGVTVNTD